MIRSFRLQNFKCFANETIDLRNLTLVAGANGAGKSSLLQGILLAEHASKTRAGYVPLNGPHGLTLGQTRDVFCQSASGPDEVVFEATDDAGKTLVWRLQERAKETLTLEILTRPTGPFVRALTYLSAERIGPRDVHGVESVPSDELTVGLQGQFTAQVLARLEA